MNSNERYDLSGRLIHFFRVLDVMDDSCPCIPENLGFNNIYDTEKISPFFLLRCAIRNTKLWATWSYRNGKRSIYGPFPAICFTEMPIAAFLETAVQRSRNGEKISTYSLLFNKKDIYSLGGRPVIYALSNNDVIYPDGNAGGPRIFDNSFLNIREQYRYVTYNPISPSPVDWTHEREWRWPYYDDITVFEKELEECGIVEDSNSIPGLYLNIPLLTDIGVIVENESEVLKILFDILCLIYRKVININTFAFILCAQRINNTSEIRDFYKENELISRSLIHIDQYLVKNTFVATSIYNFIRGKEKIICAENGVTEIIEFGKCWLWFYNIFDDRIRAMLNEGLLNVNHENKILYTPEFINTNRTLKQQEEMVKQLSIIITEELGIKCGYFSVLVFYLIRLT
jgi:hypothetical protein